MMSMYRFRPMIEDELNSLLNSTDPSRLGHRLRLLREEKQLGQKALSARLGCPEAYLNLIERGAIRPTFQLLESLLIMLGHSPVYFLQEEGA